MSKNIEFFVSTYSALETTGSFSAHINTRFAINIKIDGNIFRCSDRFETEEEAQAKIESLKSFLKPKPKKIKGTIQ